MLLQRGNVARQSNQEQSRALSPEEGEAPWCEASMKRNSRQRGRKKYVNLSVDTTDQSHKWEKTQRQTHQVVDFLRRDTYTDELLDTLAGKLNSNEEFYPDGSIQPNLLCYQTSQPWSTIRSLKGPNCCREFIRGGTLR